MNSVKTGILLIALTALLIFMGAAVDSYLHSNSFIWIFFLFSIGMNLMSYWYSDKIVLMMHGAKLVGPAELPQLHDIVNRLAAQAGMPRPKLYIVPTDVPNAFATGRNPSHAAVAVTEGILRVLDWRQLEGVLAHELSHVKNRDTLISTVAAIIAGSIMLLSRLAYFGALFAGGSRDRDRDGGGAFVALAMMILAPIAAMIIQLAISRSREYKADESGARLSHNPLALADALGTIDQVAHSYKFQGSPTMSHLYIINPLRGGGIGSLFSTHPPTEARIKRLKEIARSMGIYA